jgi:hypothetical protein
MPGIELLAAAAKLDSGRRCYAKKSLSFARLGEPSLSNDERVGGQYGFESSDTTLWEHWIYHTDVVRDMEHVRIEGAYCMFVICIWYDSNAIILNHGTQSPFNASMFKVSDTYRSQLHEPK